MYPRRQRHRCRANVRRFFRRSNKADQRNTAKASQIVALSNAKSRSSTHPSKTPELGARALNLWFETVSAQTPEELDGAIRTAAKTRTSALFIMTDAMFNTRVSRIAQLTIKNRLPSVYDRNELVESGGLMS